MGEQDNHGWFRDRPVSRARQLRREPTDVEKKLWNALKSSQLGGPRWRRQHPISPYIADFACVPLKLIVELDGSQHAESRKGAVRDSYLRAQGWKIRRFWNNQINENLEGVLTMIRMEMDKCPHPSPLP